MKQKTLRVIGLVTLIATVAQASQEKLAASISEARMETAATAAQLKTTVDALNALTEQKKGDLRPAYDTYCAEIVKTKAAAEVTKTRVQWMAGDGQKYFTEWQNTVNAINNESMRKSSQKRLDSVKASFTKVEASLKVSAEKFNPFLSDLGDIQTALSTDVTAGGVKAIRSTVSSANWNYKYVNRAVNDAVSGMNKLAKALSPDAK